MSDFPADVAKIVAEASALNDGPGKVELLQDAVRRADYCQHVEAGFKVRLRLMEAALVCGSDDVLLVAYSWCLTQAEREPDHFGLYQVLWRYRWAIVYLPTFPEIPRAKIEDAVADMTARYRSAGASLRPVHLLRWKVAMKLGDGKMAAGARRAWSRSRRDWLTDDEQTETVTQIDYHLFRRRWLEAVQLADKYIRGERQPAYLDSVLSWMPLPLLRLGRVAEAIAIHDRGYRMTTRNAALVTQAGRHMQFLALTYNFSRAIRLAERYLPYCAASDPEDKIEFYPSLLTLVGMLRRAGKEQQVRLRLAPGCPGYQASGRYELGELERVYRSAAADVGDRYDIRDGNKYY